MLAGKKILLAVCGSIAAYKTAFFVRLLVKEGAEVQVILSESATDFVTPLTMSTLSKKPVYTSYFNKESGEWHNHVELGMWADIMVVAPLSANTLGKMAHGICDSLLLATYLSAKCPVLVAPAMDLDMYKHPTTQQNLRKLISYGNKVLEAKEGELASGLTGQGRMTEPEEMVATLKELFKQEKPLKGKKVLITSGPTHEAIDPVRFIGNQSSGKMGTAIAKQFFNMGADVTIITGPVSLAPDFCESVSITSAKQMLEEVSARYDSCDIAIFAAAVADYRPASPSSQKIKKKDDSLHIQLVKNPDIAFEMGTRKKHQIHVGFALETTNEVANVQEKLSKKNFDLIVLNSLNDEGAGFQADTNQVTFFDRNHFQQKFELKSKDEVASDIAQHVISHFL